MHLGHNTCISGAAAAFSGDEVLHIQDMWLALTQSSSSVDSAVMRHNAGCAHANITIEDPFDLTHAAETIMLVS